MLNPYTLNIQESLKHAWHRGIGFLRCLAVKVLKKIIIFQGSRGGPTFPGGSNFIQGGGGGICPHPWIRTCFSCKQYFREEVVFVRNQIRDYELKNALAIFGGFRISYPIFS